MPTDVFNDNEDTVFHHAPLAVANANLVTIADHVAGHIVGITARIALICHICSDNKRTDDQHENENEGHAKQAKSKLVHVRYPSCWNEHDECRASCS